MQYRVFKQRRVQYKQETNQQQNPIPFPLLPVTSCNSSCVIRPVSGVFRSDEAGCSAQSLDFSSSDFSVSFFRSTHEDSSFGSCQPHLRCISSLIGGTGCFEVETDENDQIESLPIRTCVATQPDELDLCEINPCSSELRIEEMSERIERTEVRVFHRFFRSRSFDMIVSQ